MGREVDQHTLIIEARIVRVMEIILSGKWKTGKTPQALAYEWEIGLNRVYNYIAEANGRIRAEMGARAAKTVYRTLNQVARKGRKGVMPGDLSASVQAAKVLADLLGWNEKPKHEAEQQTQGPPTLKVEFVTPERPKESQSDG